MAFAVSKTITSIGSALLARVHFTVPKLIASNPPNFTNPHKQWIWEKLVVPNAGDWKASPPIRFSRYGALGLPTTFPTSKPTYEMRENVYTYDPVPVNKRDNEWYVNFADRKLFGFYGGNLYAQDEMQALEHPVAGAVREALMEQSLTNPNCRPVTSDKRAPTPCLVMGLERRVTVAVDKNAEKGRPDGLYGGAFHEAKLSTIQKATSLVQPVTVTNLVAMEAPAHGYGEYKRTEIVHILTTAYTAFAAAKHESQLVATTNKEAKLSTATTVPDPSITIHTGNWGTGAFGGNKVLMALLQMSAARLAGIHRLVYHTFQPEFTTAYKEAEKHLSSLSESSKGNLDTFVDGVCDLKLRWGWGDGN